MPQMSFHLYFFAIFISLWGSTHDSADRWSATASNVCTTDAWLGGIGRVPPNKNPGYAGDGHPHTHGHMHAWTHARTDTHTVRMYTHGKNTARHTCTDTHTRIRTLRIHTRGTHMHPYTYAHTHTHTHTRAVLRLVWPFDGLYKTKFNWITWSPPKYFLPIIFS